MAVKVYACKNCSASLTFNIEAQKWKCEYCASEFEKDEIQEKSLRDDGVEKVEDLTVALPELDEYSCTNCGAHLLSEGNAAATFCLYCKSPTIIKDRFSGDFHPRYVIPFKITQEKAKSMYFAWIKKRFFAPHSFKTATEVDNIRGMYAPYWLFDCKVSGYVEGEGRTSRTWTSGNYRITETQHYFVKRSGYADYTRIPVDGSEHLDDSLMEGIEPYDFSELKDFALEYMSGSLAEKYDVDQVAALPAMEPRAKGFLETSLNKSGRQYTSYTPRVSRCSVNDKKAAYAMLPIYILTNLHKGKAHTFILNGQTGKIYGETPTDQVKRLFFAFGIFALTWVVSVLLGGYISG